MKTYLVGGAVRDRLLGIPGHEVSERDWVVTGGSSEAMLAAGFRQVGRDFPVFLHPKTHEEHALARTERKSGKGYTGFTCHSDPSITLEEDLLRRDLTINAIAEDEHGELVDPFNGLQDLGQRILRHVSPAFVEDPLRVLRVARFAARFHHLGFSIADETLLLMQQLSVGDELLHLAPERIWKETEKALSTDSPQRYFQALHQCGALRKLFPEIHALFGVPQTEKHHPEIDTGIHTLMVLEQAARLTPDIPTRFAALVHDLGKALTPPNEWPRHIAHEQRGIAPVKTLCRRIRVPRQMEDLAVLVCEFHLHVHRALEMKASTIQKLFESLDLYRRPERLEPFLLACEADSRGRKGLENREYPQPAYLRDCFAAASSINANSLHQGNLTGKAIGMAITEERVRAISKVRDAHLPAGC